MAERFLAFGSGQRGARADALGDLATRARRIFGLEPVFEADALLVLAAPEMPRAQIEGRGGVVLGPLFRREGEHATVRTGDKRLGPGVARSAGDSLLKQVWGGYVAFIADDAQARVHVLRDPSGFLPCYWCAKDDLTAVFCDLDVPMALGLITPRIDPTYVAHHLTYPDLRTPRTGLIGVQDLLAGTRLTLDAQGRDLSCRWTPWSFTAPPPPVADRVAAVTRLREELDRSVAAWASTANRWLLELSGGLDSSIVGAGLAVSGAAFSAVTLATPDPGADERRYAGIMARALGARLIETELRVETADPSRGPRLALPRPGLGVLQQIADQAFVSAAQGADINGYIDGFISGGGGDSVFCYLATAAPAADALRRKGPGPTFFRAIEDLAGLHGCTVWRATLLAIRKALRPARLVWRRNLQFLNRDAAPSAPWAHPWLDMPADALPGAVEHVAAIMRIQNISDGKERLALAPVRYPLLSQPIVELCLGIPSWMWITGGRNRSVARDAYADCLPAPILQRRSKGDFVPFCGAIYDRNRADLRSRLLGGWLDREGLIDRAAVETYLDAPGPPQGEGFYRLLELAAVEAWARAWTERMRSPPQP